MLSQHLAGRTGVQGQPHMSRMDHMIPHLKQNQQQQQQNLVLW